MNSQSGLLWYKPLQQTFTLAAQQARRRFIEREGSEPGAILLNPCHQQEFLSPSPLGRGDRREGGEGQLALPLVITTLAGLPIQFDKDVRPNHLLVVANDGQKNSQRTAQHAGHSQHTPQVEVNQ